MNLITKAMNSQLRKTVGIKNICFKEKKGELLGDNSWQEGPDLHDSYHTAH